MKSRLLHLLCALGVCTASLIGYVVWYTLVADASVTLANLESQIEQKDIAAKNVVSVHSTLARVEDSETLVTSFFVPETGVVPFINDLEVRGRSLGATVDVLSVSTRGTTGRSEIVINLAASGTFDAVMRTIGIIEYAPYAATISKLTLDNDEKNVWHANFELVVGSVAAASTTKTSLP